jgi:hypothetical protein
LREVASVWGFGRGAIDEGTGGAGTDSADAGAAWPAGAGRAPEIKSVYAWLMGEGETLDRMLAGAGGQIEIAGDRVTIDGAPYSLAGRTLVCALRNPGEPSMGIGVVLSQDVTSLRAIAPRLPHYGSYSYLIFDKDKPVVKGVWEIGESPLRANLSER